MCKHTHLFRISSALLLVSAHSALFAQSNALPQSVEIRLKAQDEIALAVVQGRVKPAEALVRLQNLSASGTPQSSGTVDYSFALLDVGHRLIAAGKPAEAELFFRAAEKSLMEVLKATPDGQAQAKAQYLQHLSLIREQYLNNPAQAKLDIEHAISLQPDDKHLQSMRRHLASQKAELFKEPPTGPSTDHGKNK